MKQLFLLTAFFLLGAMVMFGGLWGIHYNQKHPYRPHFSDLKDVELIFLFEQRFTDWQAHIQKGADASSQWSELRRMGELLEEIKHRKVGDMEASDLLYDSQKEKASVWIQLQSRDH